MPPAADGLALEVLSVSVGLCCASFLLRVFSIPGDSLHYVGRLLCSQANSFKYTSALDAKYRCRQQAGAPFSVKRVVSCIHQLVDKLALLLYNECF